MAATAFLQQRLVSLDAYRGLIMIALAFNGFALARTALLHQEKSETRSWVWSAVHHQFEHVEWTGCGFWDLIQPSFMFMVGAAMAFSYLKRQQEGQSWLRMFGHALTRSLVLIFLGIFLISNNRNQTDWSLMNVLTQIGLGYPFLFLLWNRPPWVQASAAAALLVGTWLLYVSYPQAGIDLQTGNRSAGIKKEWADKYLTGLPPAWHKNANVGHAVDLVILNWLPWRDPAPPLPERVASAVGLFGASAGYKPAVAAAATLSRKPEFTFNRGGYQTINFIPSLATMIFGLLVGELLRSGRSAPTKLLVLLAAGLAGLLIGLVLDATGLCPLVKRIWTPSWALFSTGWCCLILAGLYAVIDVAGWRRWAHPLVVVGVNSIAIYVMGQMLPSWTAGMLQTHLGPRIFLGWGPLWEPTLKALLVGSVFWVACWWMYRQCIFVRI